MVTNYLNYGQEILPLQRRTQEVVAGVKPPRPNRNYAGGVLDMIIQVFFCFVLCILRFCTVLCVVSLVVLSVSYFCTSLPTATPGLKPNYRKEISFHIIAYYKLFIIIIIIMFVKG